MKPVHFVPETAQLNNLLVDFFERRQHLFCVVDEYGGMTGVISLEDIIEEIVGQEIRDESDPAETMRQLARNKEKKSGRQDAKVVKTIN
jgi:CBS domain containing-hemolysin-like protein